MARPQRWELLLKASQQEALLAVSLFNDPGRERSLEGFIIHMHIAWLYAFQAKWMRAGENYHVLKSEKPLRYKRINDERMSQPLEWFVRQEHPTDQSVVRANLEFFIALRNKIEHRHTGTDDALATIVNGECHSMLLNYEEFVTGFAGKKYSLAHRLHFPVFIGGFTDQGKSDLLKLTQTLPKDLRTFLAEYDAGLSDAVSRDPRYCMRLTILLESGNRKGDLSLQFVNYDDLTEEERVTAEEIANKRGYVITKQKTRPVSNDDKYRPGAVAAKVAAEIPFHFAPSHEMAAAWRKNHWRPPKGTGDPRNTRSDFCVYDSAHGDYLYTEVCVKWLIKKCKTEAGFREATGLTPRPKDS
ncbi:MULTISPECIES: DUF3644 domain-containing protein [Gordonia]|uniref:DUF3644 domain-containing protein n=1 Tax=Gordonia TaxID=2053 RepID=UPI000C7AE978|nr:MULTISPECIES: DUF3644 domain-containing protein [Gordonia]AUH70549.1 DUF3644 domain-containing protein [Gordonia sp. YC-JH1]WFN95093.1 DUF3644 domain-containing protein [Gordonia sihwensis]